MIEKFIKNHLPKQTVEWLDMCIGLADMTCGHPGLSYSGLVNEVDIDILKSMYTLQLFFNSAEHNRFYPLRCILLGKSQSKINERDRDRLKRYTPFTKLQYPTDKEWVLRIEKITYFETIYGLIRRGLRIDEKKYQFQKTYITKRLNKLIDGEWIFKKLINEKDYQYLPNMPILFERLRNSYLKVVLNSISSEDIQYFKINKKEIDFSFALVNMPPNFSKSEMKEIRRICDKYQREIGKVYSKKKFDKYFIDISEEYIYKMKMPLLILDIQFARTLEKEGVG